MMALTELTLKTLAPKDKRYTKLDSRGLSIEVMPSGVLSWRYRYRLRGKLEKVVLGKYPTLSLKAAREERDQRALVVVRGESPAQQKRLQRQGFITDPTLRDFGEMFYSDIAARVVKDPTEIRRSLDKQIYPFLGQKRLKEVSAEDIQTLVFRKRDQGFEAAAARLRNLLKRIFDYALVRGQVPVNPALALPTRFITRTRPRTRALSTEEVRGYLHTLYRSNIRRQFKLSLHLILLTLVRKSELLRAQWKDVSIESREWQIPAENSKTGKPHVVYLSSQAAALFIELKALSCGSEWVLPSRSSVLRPFSKTALNKALDGVNFAMEPFTIHDLRRTGSTLLHEQGFAADVIEKALNHTIGGVRGVYNRAEYGEQRQRMLQQWGDFLETLATERNVVVGNFRRSA
jgi:integrase